MLPGECCICQHIDLGVIHQAGELGHPRAQLVSDVTPLLAGSLAFDRPMQKDLHAFVDVGAQARHLVLGDAGAAHGLRQASTLRVEMPCT